MASRSTSISLCNCFRTTSRSSAVAGSLPSPGMRFSLRNNRFQENFTAGSFPRELDAPTLQGRATDDRA